MREKGQLTQSYSPPGMVCQRPFTAKTNTMNTFIVTLSLPSRSPHHYRVRLLTARALGRNLTGSKQRLEVGLPQPLLPGHGE
jgi:hypothetical protein